MSKNVTPASRARRAVATADCSSLPQKTDTSGAVPIPSRLTRRPVRPTATSCMDRSVTPFRSAVEISSVYGKGMRRKLFRKLSAAGGQATLKTVEGEAATPRVRAWGTQAARRRRRAGGLGGSAAIAPASRRCPDPPRHLDLRRAGRLGERHGRHAGRGRPPDLRRVASDVYWRATGPRCGRRSAAWSSADAGVRRRPGGGRRAGPAAQHHPAGRHRQRRARGWRWRRACSSSSVASRGPTAVAAIAVFFFVFVSTTVGLGAAPAAAHDVASVLGASRVPARCGRCSSRRRGRRSPTGSSWPPRRRWPARSSASGTAPPVASACC